ncbi:MAG: hypothetical protein RIS64_4083 [Bacteroidota bacterium]
MNWYILNTIDGVEEIKARSHEMPCIIFKHSTTCSISHIAKSRLERDWCFEEVIAPYYLDLKTNQTKAITTAPIAGAALKIPKASGPTCKILSAISS